MKKITILLVLLFASWQISAQILTESFDAVTYPPTGWTNIQVAGTGTTSTWNRSTTGTSPTIAAAHSGAGMSRYNCYSFSTGKAADLSTAVLDLSVGGPYQVSFWMYRDNGYSTSADKVDVYANTTQASAAGTLLGTINRSISLAPSESSNGWYQYTFVIPASFNTSTNYIIFKATSAYGNNIFIDDVSVELPPSCLSPTALAATNITTTSADLGWTAGGTETAWNIEWGATGFTQGAGTMVTGATVNPHALSGLTANTTYQFYVQANCGTTNGTSTWAGPFSFTTPCAAFTAPFAESFDATTLPSCWSQSSTTGGPWVFGNSGISWNTSGCAAAPTEHTSNGGNMVSMDHSATDVGVILEMPDVDVSSLTTPMLTFWYFMCNSGYSPINPLYIEAWNGSAWTMVNSNTVGTNGWEELTYDISTFTFGTNLVRLRFRAESGGSVSDYYGDAGIDDVSIVEAPSCLSPTALAATNITTTSADLGWTAGGTETAWNIEWGATGFTQGAGTMVTGATVNPHALSGLTANTTYQFYVQADCGTTNGTSTWAGPFSFTTLPDYCAGDHSYDNGGATGNYLNGTNETTVINSSTPGDIVTVTFNTFGLEAGYDFLTIYDGVGTAGTSFGTFTGTTIPGPFTSTDISGSLTFVFTSDGSVNGIGWDATITCSPPPLPASPIIISQYIETNSGTTPKGIELWNVSGVSIDFSVYPLTILQGTNGGTPSPLVTVNTGVIAPNEVFVIGTSDIGTYLTTNGLASVLYQSYIFTFNGDDALMVMIDGDTSDVFGEPGVDPGSSWSGNGVSTANQNISLKAGILTGNVNGWSDPSIRFNNIGVGTVLTNIGIPPVLCSLASSTSTDTQVSCDSLSWIDGVTYTASNTTATHTLTNAAGCDSIVTLALTINSSTTSTDTQVACDTYTWIDGVTYTASNTTSTHTLTNAAGCDSIVTLDLTINSSTTSTDTQVACDTYTWLDGVTYTASNTTATYTSTNAAGCTNVATLNLTINSSTTSTDTQVACDTYTWLDGTTYTASNTTATYTSTNAAGCTNVATLNLTINSSTTSTDTQVACDTYTWLDGTTYTASNTTATYTSTNAAGCDSVITLNLTVNPLPTATIVASGSTIFCIGGSVVLTASTGSTYLWSNGAQTQSITVTTSGSYTVTVTNASGCSLTSAATVVTVNALPSVSPITGASNVCVGSSTTLASSTTGGTWSSSNTAVATVSATGIVTGVTVGSATIIYSVANASGCTTTATASASIAVGPVPSIVAQSDTICSGSSFTITPTNGGSNAVPTGTTYAWSAPTVAGITGTTAGIAATSITGTLTNTTNSVIFVDYIVTPTSGFCAGATFTVSVTVYPTPLVVTQTATICSGSNFTVSPANGANVVPLGTTYTWTVVDNPFILGESNVSVAQAAISQTLLNMVSTVQSVVYTVTPSSGSCVGSPFTLTASVNALPVVVGITGASNVCAGSTTTLASSTPSGTWSSSNTAVATVSATGVVTGVAFGSVTITYSVTNTAGCTASTTASITVNSPPTATIAVGGATTFCSGGSVVLTASAGSSYSWSNGPQTQSITATTSGSYTVTVTNASGCSATSPATVVTVNALPVVAAITGASNVCAGSTTTLASSTTGGTWSSSNNAVATVSTTGVVTGVAAGSVTITYSVTNVAGCTSSTTASMTINPSATATIAAGGATTFCAGGSVVLTASTGSTYLWSNGLQTQSITATAGGSYTVTVTNASGCSAMSTATAVTVNGLPVVSAITGASNVCTGSTTTLASSTAGGTWSSSNTAVATVNATGVVTGVAFGSATITYSVTNVAGCTASTTASMTVNPPATATVAVGGATTFCAGGSVVLTASAGSTYSWSNGAQTQSINATTSGTYTVTVTNASGCSATSTATVVTVNALPVVAAITGASNVCTGSTTTLASSTTGGTWSSSNTAIATVSTTGVVTGVATGSVTITYSVTSTAGCTASTAASIAVNQATSATQTVVSCGAYYWALNGSNYTATGLYNFTIMNAAGCDSIVTLNLTVINTNLTVVNTSPTLTSNELAAGTTHQWIDCGNSNAPIAGATSISYTATVNGSYAVIVTKNNCTDTSACQIVANIGLKEVTSDLNVTLFPNPTNDFVKVQYADITVLNIEILDATGKLIFSQKQVANGEKLDFSNFQRGVYIVRLTSDKGTKIERIVKK